MVTTEIIKKDVGTIAELKVKRKPEGISVWVKSEVIENMYKKNSRTDAFNSPNGIFLTQGYRPKSGFPDVFGKTLTGTWGVVWILDGAAANGAILTSVGLSEGVEIIFKGPASVDQIKSWVDAMKEGIQKMYQLYIKPFDIDVAITFKEMA